MGYLYSCKARYLVAVKLLRCEEAILQALLKSSTEFLSEKKHLSHVVLKKPPDGKLELIAHPGLLVLNFYACKAAAKRVNRLKH